MIVHILCPVCKSSQIKLFKSVTDHSVSNESFEVFDCISCSLRFTQGIPDMQSIGRYYQSADYISHTDSKKGLFNLTYQLIRSYALTRKRKLIEQVSSKLNGQILDYGCGTGAFLLEMQSYGWQVDGIEPDAGAREKASSLTNISVKTTDALSTLRENHYDVITLWHVLEHVHHLEETILRLQKAIKSDGKLIIAVPNYTSFDGQTYDTAWAAYDVPRHLYHFSPKSMRILMHRMGFQVESIKPMWFDAFYVSLLSEKYKKRGLKFLHAVLVGIKSNLHAVFNKEKCSSVIYIIKKSA